MEEPPAHVLATWAKRASDSLIEYTEQLTSQVHHLQALLDASQATVAGHASTIKNLSHRLAEAETQLVIDERQFASLLAVVQELNDRLKAVEATQQLQPATPAADGFLRVPISAEPVRAAATPSTPSPTTTPNPVPPPPPVLPPNAVTGPVIDLRDRTPGSALSPPTATHPRRQSLA
ncbi:MAG: hypothetical protein AB7L13_00015 [Acidimicrobiia bacterium]